MSRSTKNFPTVKNVRQLCEELFLLKCIFLLKGSAMTKATFVNFFYRSYQVLLTCCYYTQVTYTGSWEPIVVPWQLQQSLSNRFRFFGLSHSTRCGCCSYQVSSISVWRVTCYGHFCVFQFFCILAISMAMAAILKKINP